jgi:hypothetical protein
MATTYEKIATTTLGSSSATITFSSIPATYTDLRIVFLGTLSTYGSLAMQFNSDTSSNYSATFLYGNPASSYRQTSQVRLNLTDTGNVAGLDATNACLYTIDIFSYASSTFKTSLFQGGVDYFATLNTGVGLWRSTSAINTIQFLSNGSNQYGTGTSVTIYGIKVA